MTRRVAITGLGAVSPVGNTVEDMWSALAAGKSGAHLLDPDKLDVDLANLKTHFGATVQNFDPSLALDKKEVRRLDVFVQYAVEAARQALLDSGLEITEALSARAGVAVGSGIGGLPWISNTTRVMDKSGPSKISPFFIPGAIINMAPGYISMKHHLRGPNISIVTACTTGAHNIGDAMRMVQYGDADVMLAGGAEMATCGLGVGGFNSARALSTRNDAPEKASRPWDKDRDGFVLGDGAGVLVLEELEHAKNRGAKIYAELAGYGMSADAYHMTAPDPEGRGFRACMRHALNDAGVNPEDVDYVNAHGTSTHMLDPLEANAVKQIFGDHAYKFCVSSTKSMTGHLLGAAGAVEAIISVLAIRDNVAPPTINLDNPEDGCDLDFVAHTAQERKIDCVLSNSFGFGGTNGSLLFRRHQ